MRSQREALNHFSQLFVRNLITLTMFEALANELLANDVAMVEDSVFWQKLKCK